MAESFDSIRKKPRTPIQDMVSTRKVMRIKEKREFYTPPPVSEIKSIRKIKKEIPVVPIISEATIQITPIPIQAKTEQVPEKTQQSQEPKIQNTQEIKVKSKNFLRRIIDNLINKNLTDQ